MDPGDIVEAQLVPDPTEDRRPVRWRELLAIVAIVALADVTVYRGHGYSGLAVLLLGTPLLLLWGAPPLAAGQPPRRWGSLLVVVALLLGLAVKTVWCGWELHIPLGCVLLLAFALALSGTTPYVLEVLVFPARMLLGGLLGLSSYARLLHRPRRNVPRTGWLSVGLPLAAFIAFSLLFILANPDLLDAFGTRVEQLLTAVRRWLIAFSPPPEEFVFWAVAAWLAVALLRPLLSRPLFERMERDELESKAGQVVAGPSPLYEAARNTLVTVLVLFAIYLVFEFKTLWFRKFPPGFYYSGYAHQGAAWLTVALALATGVLSLVFRGSLLRDARVKKLRRLAWMWSLENLLLAIAVYHRLAIYVGFNGMTRMRVVGFLGITSVLIGFLLVVWKIAQNRGFLWLLRRHLWTVALAVYVYSVLPVDVMVVGYNVKRIMRGDSAPSVQITEHAISTEGVLQLPPLLDCPDAQVREGVRAYLAARFSAMEQLQQRQKSLGWTSFQCADQLLLRRLSSRSAALAPYRDPQLREQRLQQFRDYAYQWY